MLLFLLLSLSLTPKNAVSRRVVTTVNRAQVQGGPHKVQKARSLHTKNTKKIMDVQRPGSSLKCHNDDDLQMYLSAMRKSGEFEQGRAYSCLYDYEKGRFSSHSFVSIGEQAINCYDLPVYSEDTAARWHSSGCTPFRRVVRRAKEIMQCVRGASTSAWLPEDEEVMQRASKYFWESTHSEGLLALERFIRRRVVETVTDYGLNFTEDWWQEQAAEAATAVRDCFRGADGGERVQHTMKCLPASWGRVGFGLGGLRNEGLQYVSDGQGWKAESLRFNCKKSKGKSCKESCPWSNELQPLACPRLAVASMAHFSRRVYSQRKPMVRWMQHQINLSLGASLGWCKKENRSRASNCMLFTQCVHAEMNDLCTSIPECCPKPLGLRKTSAAELQVVKVKSDDDGDEESEGYLAGAKELARKQALFTDYGCNESCADSFNIPHPDSDSDSSPASATL
eukprot:TRINITY_DN55914_c0_g1_i1.p1 TRINITY_DN55914_c0_g1~~TRINITY_DN55914_c0_g1_i1.p1  ORF type:complete len:452 (+),score=24.29 TRINITY_DN55914_c0_g1_i1:46-1401(+)